VRQVTYIHYEGNLYILTGLQSTLQIIMNVICILRLVSRVLGMLTP